MRGAPALALAGTGDPVVSEPGALPGATRGVAGKRRLPNF